MPINFLFFSYINSAVVQVGSKAGHVLLQKPPLGKLVSECHLYCQTEHQKLYLSMLTVLPARGLFPFTVTGSITLVKLLI